MENYLTTKEALIVIRDNTKAWFKKNWKKFVAGGAVVGAVAIAIAKNINKEEEDTDMNDQILMDYLVPVVVRQLYVEPGTEAEKLIQEEMIPQCKDEVRRNIVSESGIVEYTLSDRDYHNLGEQLKKLRGY